jgi:LytS/YehU family sensor histidine kinase
MCEDVGLEWFSVEGEQDVLVFLEEFVTYCLRDKSKNQSLEKPIDAVVAYLDIVERCFQNRLRISQHRDTIGVNASKEEKF